MPWKYALIKHSGTYSTNMSLGLPELYADAENLQFVYSKADWE